MWNGNKAQKLFDRKDDSDDETETVKSVDEWSCDQIVEKHGSHQKPSGAGRQTKKDGRPKTMLISLDFS